MQKKPVAAVLVAMVTAGTLLGAASPARAAATSSSIVYTDGTRAAEAFFNRPDASHDGRAWFDAYDAKCDAKPVWVVIHTTLNPRAQLTWPNAAMAGPRFGHEHGGGDDGGHDRQVDPEDGVPPETVDQGEGGQADLEDAPPADPIGS